MISTVPSGTWEPWAAGPSQAHPTIPNQEGPLKSGEERAGPQPSSGLGPGKSKLDLWVHSLGIYVPNDRGDGYTVFFRSLVQLWVS